MFDHHGAVGSQLLAQSEHLCKQRRSTNISFSEAAGTLGVTSDDLLIIPKSASRKHALCPADVPPPHHITTRLLCSSVVGHAFCVLDGVVLLQRGLHGLLSPSAVNTNKKANISL